MGLVVTRDHFEVLLDRWEDLLRKCTLHLYVNDHEPREDDTRGNYAEPEDPWYEPALLEAWQPAFINAEGKGEKDHDYVIFPWYPPAVVTLIYGYFILDFFGYLLAAERDPSAPVNLGAPGQTYVVKPRLTLRNEPAPLPQPLRVIP
jgi:hypothetical protein